MYSLSSGYVGFTPLLLLSVPTDLKYVFITTVPPILASLTPLGSGKVMHPVMSIFPTRGVGLMDIRVRPTVFSRNSGVTLIFAWRASR